MISNCKGSSLTDLRTAIEEFVIDRKVRGSSPATLACYRYQLAPFSNWCQGTGVDLSDLSASHLRLYVTCRREISLNSMREAVVRLRTFFRWCAAEELCVDHAAKIQPPRIDNKVVPALSVAQVRSMIALCKSGQFVGLRDELFIRVIVDTGMRVGEAVAVGLSDIVLSDSQILIQNAKGRKQRLVYFGPRTAKCLMRYLRERRKLAPASNCLLICGNGLPMNRRHAHQQLARLALRAGVSGVRVSPHTLRHTFATWFLRSGGDVFSLQRQLGQSSLSMTRRYLDLAQNDVAAAHGLHSPGNQL